MSEHLANVRGRLPLYFQIETVLRERIRSGHYPPGSGFPTEDQLRREFAVSRGTVRAALDALHRDGLIGRHPGRGAFVTGEATRPRTLRLGGSIQELIAQGTETVFRITECGLVTPDATEAAELRVPDGRRVMRATGVRMSEGRRVARLVVSLPETLGVLLGLRAGDTTPPIASLLMERLGQKIREARQVIDVVVADQALASAVDIPVGSPLLRIKRTYFSGEGNPVEFAVSCYPAEKYQYETTIST